MRNILVLSTVASVLTLGLGSSGVTAAKPTALQGLVQKVQSGGEKAPGRGALPLDWFCRAQIGER